MDARTYMYTEACEFIDDLKQWLAIPSISADPAHHDDVRRSAEWLASHLKAIGCPIAEVWDTAPDRPHAPNERIDLSLLLRGAEVSAYLWEELATVGADLS